MLYPPAAALRRTKVPAVRLLTAVFACTALVLGACSDGSETTPEAAPTATAPAPQRPALCGALQVREAGRVDAAGARELSGLVVSRRQDGVLWAHNDSGDQPRLFALRPDGSLLREVPVQGATATDWEDIAATADALLVGDIGDNDGRRPQIVVDRIDEPPATGTDPAQARPVALRYPDGAHDAEALLADPDNGELVLVTKDLDGRSGVYAAPAKGGELRRTGTLRLGLLQLVTAGDVSADGQTVALRTYDRIYVWTRAPGEVLTDTLKRPPCSPDLELAGEGQGEALALTADGRSAYTVPEGTGPVLRSYAPTG